MITLFLSQGDFCATAVLLTNDVDINAKTDNGKTALTLAEESSHPEIVQLLKEAVSKQ